MFGRVLIRVFARDAFVVGIRFLSPDVIAYLKGIVRKFSIDEINDKFFF